MTVPPFYEPFFEAIVVILVAAIFGVALMFFMRLFYRYDILGEKNVEKKEKTQSSDSH